MTKEIPIVSGTFEEKVNQWINILSTMRGAGRNELYLSAWDNLQALVNTRDDWSYEKKINYVRVCEKVALDNADAFIASRVSRGYMQEEKIMSKQCPCHCRCCISDGCGASEDYPKDENGELDGGIN